jgi:hypothetical protein
MRNNQPTCIVRIEYAEHADNREKFAYLVIVKKVGSNWVNTTTIIDYTLALELAKKLKIEIL